MYLRCNQSRGYKLQVDFEPGAKRFEYVTEVAGGFAKNVNAHSGGTKAAKGSEKKKKFQGIGGQAGKEEDEFYDAIFDQIETIGSQSKVMATAIDTSTKLAQQTQDMVVETNGKVGDLNERADGWLRDNS